jgi:hypothetical protein
MCDIKSLLSLHLNHMEVNPFNVFNMLAPFANEFANLFTITKIANVYPHHPNGYMDLAKKYSFDILALTGIVSNAIITGGKLNYALGLIKGLLYLIFAFTIPNIFMHDILYSTTFKNNKLLTGLVVIYLLELTIISLFCVAKKYLYKENKEKENKEKENKEK